LLEEEEKAQGQEFSRKPKNNKTRARTTTNDDVG